MEPTTRILYRPHRHQLAFHKARQRIKALIAGARSGKTTGGAQDVFIRAMTQPGYLERDRLEGKHYTIACGAPTYKDLWDIVIPEMFRVIPQELIVNWSASRKRLTIRAAGRDRYTDILFRNCQAAERWEGLQLYGVWLDEAAQMNAAIYDEVRTRLADRQGTLILTGTPKGKNWVYKEVFQRAKKRPDDIFCRVYPTADNPYFPRAELKLKRETMPDRYFRRTFMASFDEFAGQIYDEYRDDVHVVDQYPKHSDGRHKFVKIVAGVDWGYTNRGVILVFGVTKDNDWYGIAESSASRVLIKADAGSDSWVRRAKLIEKQWGRGLTFWCDPSEPGNIETFRRANLHAKPALNDVYPGIQDVATLLHVDPLRKRPRLFIVGHRCPKLVEMLPAYHWKETKDGKLREEPEKTEDHECDAMRYAVHSELRRAPAPRWADKPLIPY